MKMVKSQFLYDNNTLGSVTKFSFVSKKCVKKTVNCKKNENKKHFVIQVIYDSTIQL